MLVLPINELLRNARPAPNEGAPSIDFETRSTVDLKSAGSRRYAQDPSTDILCLCIKWGLAEDVWVPGMPFPTLLAEAIRRNVGFRAWNATFEIAIWQEIAVKRYGFPEVPVTKFSCTMQKAALVGCPGALERAVVALRLPVRKNMDGHRLMLKMCKPLPARKDDPPGTIRWHDDPDDHLRLQAYCMDDCRAEAMAESYLPPPPPMEVALQRVDRFINMRGIMVDRLAAEGAAKIARQEKARLNAEMVRITNGAIGSTNQVALILDFVQRRGVSIDRLRASDVRDVLAENEDDDSGGDLDVSSEQLDAYSALEGGGVDPAALTALSLRAEAAKASTSKLDALVKGVNADSCMTDMFAYSAAYRTQRWAGRRFQAHNLPRMGPPCETEDQVEVWYETLASGRYQDFVDLLPTIKGKKMTVMDGLKASLRGFLTARRGRKLCIADLGQIEARVAGWIAGQWDVIEAFERLDAAVSAGASEDEIKALDIYTITGKKMGFDRQSGKIATLACSYGGGYMALMVFAAIYGTNFSEVDARNIVDAWRAANPMIVMAWALEERCARAAIDNPGTVIPIGDGRVGAYFFSGGNLQRKLPSGRCLIYRNVAVIPQPTPWGQMRMTITYEGNIFAKGQPGVFIRQRTYAGKLFQNSCQAVARDVLAAGLIRAERMGLECVLHVHDEQAIDTEASMVAVNGPRLVRAMTDPLPWLPGLPIASSADVSFRYRK